MAAGAADRNSLMDDRDASHQPCRPIRHASRSTVPAHRTWRAPRCGWLVFYRYALDTSLRYPAARPPTLPLYEDPWPMMLALIGRPCR